MAIMLYHLLRSLSRGGRIRFLTERIYKRTMRELCSLIVLLPSPLNGFIRGTNYKREKPPYNPKKLKTDSLRHKIRT